MAGACKEYNFSFLPVVSCLHVVFVTPFFPGPLAGALAKRFSARVTVMTFNLLSALGLIVGSLSTTVPVLLVSFLLIGMQFR